MFLTNWLEFITTSSINDSNSYSFTFVRQTYRKGLKETVMLLLCHIFSHWLVGKSKTLSEYSIGEI